MSRDPALVHREWLGYVQPTGLVVSIPALLDASAVLNQNYGPEHQRFLSALPQDDKGEHIPEIPDFAHFAQTVFNWDTSLLAGAPGSEPVPNELEVNLENYNETLRPTYALRALDGTAPWLMLVAVLPTGTDMDEPYAPHDRAWHASPQVRFERLLRQTKVPIGLLVNGREIRLVYAPEKELSGHITFKLAEMVQVAGRPIFSALHMLLESERLYSVADKERLPAILENSRKYQNVVSTKLAEQVVEALYELLRGFQAANDQFKGVLLGDVLQRDPDEVYRGLLTTLLRLVFVLYAEDRGLLSTDPIYSNYYSITGLYERLRGDAGRYTDTLDQRYGAWAQLLSLFRLIYSGGSHGAMKIPPREGYLFDPDRYLFLEGRHNRKDKPEIPHVPDGVIYRVLSKLLLLDGERLSYRTLAVEQIGSVYEAIMGFEIQVAAGQSIAIKPVKRHGAPTTINLEELLRNPAEKRQKWLTEATDQKLTGQAAEALKSASTIEELLAALDKKIAKTVTPNMVPHGAMTFQPSNERRKSGSHYTPSSLTSPIVQGALEPVLKQLGENPTPEQLMNLKVCDPAMGSGAFLVEACRQLGDALVQAWHAHGDVPLVPPDEDEALCAQRIIAQRCLYGVDKNAMAVDLAKLSLWLATLARNHPFTFLDHSLRFGDSLVGLTRQQIAAFNWAEGKQQTFLEQIVRTRIERVGHYRRRILAARDDVPYALLKEELDGADESLELPRLVGDAVIAAFFSADKQKARDNARIVLRGQTEAMLKDPTDLSAEEVESAVEKLRHGSKGITPFHWELEFPEVFAFDKVGKTTGGFDVIVGNPPFIGGKKISTAFGDGYRDWLSAANPESNSSADLAAYFFRRSFALLAHNRTFGLIATNTIAQGDTRSAGLRWICLNGGTIYRATKRLRWPGEAAVVVSVVHVFRGHIDGPFLLNHRRTENITAYLFHAGGHEDPSRLLANSDESFVGSYVLGKGFTFDDEDSDAEASSLEEMRCLIARDPRNQERIFPYLGGDEVNNSPVHAHHRFVIDFEDFPLERREDGISWFRLSEETQNKQLRAGVTAKDYPRPVASDWPDLIQIVRAKVKPDRDRKNRDAHRLRWWQYADRRPGLVRELRRMATVLAINCGACPHLAIARVGSKQVFAHSLVLFTCEAEEAFTVLQSRPHEVWARFFASSMKDDLRYTPSDCFETFPFPAGYESRVILETVGREYYDFRASLMIRNNEGLTKTYNRFHDPDDDSADLLRLRELHRTIDRAVLDAYGWQDIQPVCEFLPEFDDEDEEDDNGRPKRKKYRYRWPEDIHDEVLARLLALNRQRALEEGQVLPDAAATTTAAKPKKPSTKRTKAKNEVRRAPATPTLFAKGAGEN